MSRSRDFGSAAGSLAAPSSANNGYSYVVDTTQASGWNVAPNTNPNWLINGGAEIWQRGTTWTADNKFIADRWFWSDTSVGGQSSDVPSGQGFSSSMYFAHTATGHYPRIDYYMPSEEAIFLAGKTVTMSFWAKNNSAGTAGFYGEQQIPTSANVFGGGVNNLGGPTFAAPSSFSTSWQKYTWTFVVNATAATNGLLLHVFRDTSSASSTLVTGLKLELGSVATPFVRYGQNYTGEFIACQRYFQLMPPTYVQALSAGSAGFNWYPSIPMRTTPALTLTGSPSTTVYYESAAWSLVGSLTAASVNNGHITGYGGDILLAGTFSPAANNQANGAYPTKIGAGIGWMNFNSELR